MRLHKTLAFVAAALSFSVATIGCTSPSTAPTAQSPQESLILIDADSHGYITYDTDSEVLTGYAKDGAEKWRENRFFPTDVHCTLTCPNAAISATVDTNPSQHKTRVIWKGNGRTRTQAFPNKSMIVHWGKDEENWVATSESSLLWSTAGKIHAKKFQEGLADSFGSIADDEKTLIISIQENTSRTWAAFRFTLDSGQLAPAEISESLPGSIGCLSPHRRTMVTLGENSAEFSLTTGEKIRDLAEFSSDCASSSESTIVGAFSAGSGEATQEISMFPASPSLPPAKVTVNSSGEIGIFRDCGVLLSDGKLASLSAEGKKTETEFDARSMLTAPDGRIYSISSSGKVGQHTISAKGQACRIG
ncbi:hypothetical protein [Streptomyces sp. NBC_00391]|uniref:hypothetical protein n=1 Tax=Streptomyces sp. NBC_00391 TaxID=2903647 RepID=UPI002E1C390A